jgi:hypothetical protein
MRRREVEETIQFLERRIRLWILPCVVQQHVQPVREQRLRALHCLIHARLVCDVEGNGLKRARVLDGELLELGDIDGAAGGDDEVGGVFELHTQSESGKRNKK